MEKTIFSYFDEIRLTDDQQMALEAISSFIDDENSSIFILKGYAGSGKTTLLKGINKYLIETKKIVPEFMAPTGRATHVLNQKLGKGNFAMTIHRFIYAMEGVRNKKEGNNECSIDRIVFGIRNIDKQQHELKQRIIIVDEASMISACIAHSAIFQFGTDNLLEDLLTYASPHNKGKIIFVGDDAQLPPVFDRESTALDPEYFIAKKLKVMEVVMKQVVRQSDRSIILGNATILRDLLLKEHRNELTFEMAEGEFESILRDEVIKQYCERNPLPDFNKSSLICYSNKLAKEYNDEIRKIVFPDARHVVAGDLVMIIHNDYKTYGHDLYNGDTAKILKASEEVETLCAPVWTESNGVKIKIYVSLSYRNVIMQLEDGFIFSAKIIDSLLENNASSLTVEEIKSQIISMNIRKVIFPEKDPYFNAVQAKYAYALTCHKSQGGEWKNVYVDFTGRTGLDDHCIRWMYTAITRSSSKLYAVNLPHITPLQKMSFDGIGKASKSPAICLLKASGSSPFHPIGTKSYLIARYEEVVDKLSYTTFRIDKVKSDPYKEEYYIKDENDLINRFDTNYDGMGIFSPFVSLPGNKGPYQLILDILNGAYDYEYDVKYIPSESIFEQLYQKISCATSELGIAITNIIETIASYNVLYCFKTDGHFSYIQFFFDGSHKFTRALPKSDIGVADVKLNNLIQKLN